jgi:hypothetical protein
MRTDYDPLQCFTRRAYFDWRFHVKDDDFQMTIQAFMLIWELSPVHE